jgi:putative tributyrin esterase
VRLRVAVVAAVAAAILVVVGIAAAAVKPAARAKPIARPAAPVASFRSSALRARESFAIALPPGYATSNRRYPVVYVLHGLPGGATDYRAMPVERMASTAASAGHPSIVVAPQGAGPSHPDDEWHDWGPGRNWETAISSELVRYVDRHWRTVADRGSRAIIGMSAGGYGAALIGLHHLETFAVIESWSGYFSPTTPDGSATLHVGSAGGDLAASAHSFVRCLSLLDRAYRPDFIGFFIGAQDRYSGFVADNRRLHGELVAAGVPHRFAIYRGGHTNSFWAAHERSWLLDGISHLDATAPRTPTDVAAAVAAKRRAGCPTA